MTNMNEDQLVQAIQNADNAYQDGVIQNLRELEAEGGKAAVRFGLTGEGQTPNYQIEVTYTFKGVNHESHERQAFKEGNITERKFSLEELNRIFGRD